MYLVWANEEYIVCFLSLDTCVCAVVWKYTVCNFLPDNHRLQASKESFALP